MKPNYKQRNLWNSKFGKKIFIKKTETFIFNFDIPDGKKKLFQNT